jgi:hypothetical protein
MTAMATFLAAAAALGAAVPPTPDCEARSPPTIVPVVELYTSEGCSSCPPADRWVSRLRGDAQAVVLSFHVDYWDGLGWKDRFAQARFSARQRDQLAVNGARQPYTPQVVVNGRDLPGWHRLDPTALPGAAKAAAAVSLHLRRVDGGGYQATVLGLSQAPARLQAYWAVTEGPHRTAVKAGENRGETLSHDFIVSEWQPVPGWAAGPNGSHTLEFTPGAPASETAAARQVNLVVLDERNQRPVQAIKLGC